MTDFCVSAVKYDQTEQHIEWLEVREDLGSSVGEVRRVPRAFVADLIRKGCATFQTITRDPTTKKWQDGATLHVIDKFYLSTDPNDIKKDNLGKLPRFT
jgi:hypothetical protein